MAVACVCASVRELGRPLGVVPFAADAAVAACLLVISATGRPHVIWMVRLEHFCSSETPFTCRISHFGDKISNAHFWAPFSVPMGMLWAHKRAMCSCARVC